MCCLHKLLFCCKFFTHFTFLLSFSTTTLPYLPNRKLFTHTNKILLVNLSIITIKKLLQGSLPSYQILILSSYSIHIFSLFICVSCTYIVMQSYCIYAMYSKHMGFSLHRKAGYSVYLPKLWRLQPFAADRRIIRLDISLVSPKYPVPVTILRYIYG